MINMKQFGLPSCEDVSLLISQTHDRPLSSREQWKIRLHVAMCRYCTRFKRQLHVLRRAVQKDKQGDLPDAKPKANSDSAHRGG